MKKTKLLIQGFALLSIALFSLRENGAADQAPEADFTSVDLRKVSETKQAPRTSPQTDLSDSFAYPVPFMPSVGDKRIVFANLTPEAHIEVRTLHGDLVKELEERDGDGEMAWDVKNSRGESLASDVYLYTIRSGQEAKTGKIVILQ